MADIAGIGGTSPIETTRSVPVDDTRPEDEELQAQETTELDASSTEATSEAPATNGTGTTTETNTDQTATATGEREITDQVTLSPEAQQAVQSQETAAADEFAPANDTNQDERDENRTGVVNGNQNEQSEQTRALGQIVDQFA